MNLKQFQSLPINASKEGVGWEIQLVEAVTFDSISTNLDLGDI